MIATTAGAPAVAQPPADRAWRPPAPPPPPPPRPATGRERPARSINPSAWIGADDYPIEALREDAAGAVSVRYNVRADGRVDQCAVTRSSSNIALDEATCALLTARARFEPARGMRGEPVQSYRSQRIVWKLPFEAEPVQFQAGRAVVVAPVDRHGVAACDLRTSHPALDPVAFDICAEIFPGRGSPSAVTALVTFREGEAGASPALPTTATASSLIEARFTIEPDGRISGCRDMRSGPPLSFCDLLGGGAERIAYFAPHAGRRTVRAELRLYSGRLEIRP